MIIKLPAILVTAMLLATTGHGLAKQGNTVASHWHLLDGNAIWKQLAGAKPTKKQQAIVFSAMTTPTPEPCENGCVTSIGTQNAPTAPPPIDTAYNGRNPAITSYPTTQP